MALTTEQADVVASLVKSDPRDSRPGRLPLVLKNFVELLAEKDIPAEEIRRQGEDLVKKMGVVDGEPCPHCDSVHGKRLNPCLWECTRPGCRKKFAAQKKGGAPS
jgi:hypothetical protein